MTVTADVEEEEGGRSRKEQEEGGGGAQLEINPASMMPRTRHLGRHPRLGRSTQAL
jgi:hypothetical protein